jgi:TonB family protein
MPRRFWQNVTLIALAHVALVLAWLRWAGETRAANAPEITWLGGGVEASAAADIGSTNLGAKTDATPELAPGSPTPEPAETAPRAKSEIVLPNPTPLLTPSPSATAKKSPTASPKAAPRKKNRPKPGPTPAKKEAAKKQTAAKANTVAAVAGRGAVKKDGRTKSTGGHGDGTSGTGSGKSDAATATYYGNMLHDRFYRAWNQPQTVVSSGARLSAVARIRIEKDGRVSDFKIVKPSGNVLVDESVAAAGKKVTQVDALPSGMGSGGHYDVNISFALNSQ